MNKFEIRRKVIDNENAGITFDFVNDTVVLLIVTGDKVTGNTVIDTFNNVDFGKKRQYWLSFLEKCGREIPRGMSFHSYEYEKEVAQILLEKGIQDLD
ncbi:hypothetical protein [Bacillus thuringiensis]|uniref:hypothetical protein n=1 Tax=Bacillus thuringiensis TaxID=1428 RepID=UPI000BFDD941|nr:hypothetical protein [Bacillus thuringiensis]PGT90022.1 hypothetical protein COD17_09740 [Bacillus thuringiensis]